MDVQQAYVEETLKNKNVDRIHGIPGFRLKDVFGESGEVGTKSEVRSAYKLNTLTDEFPYVEIFHSVVLHPPYDIDHIIIMGWVVILIDDKRWARNKKYVFSTVKNMVPVEDTKNSDDMKVVFNNDNIQNDNSSIESTVENTDIEKDTESVSRKHVDDTVALPLLVEERRKVIVEPSIIQATRDGELFPGSKITVHKSEKILQEKFNGLYIRDRNGFYGKDLSGYTIYSIIAIDSDSTTVLVNETDGEIRVVHQYELLDMVRKLLSTNGTHFFGCRDIKHYCEDAKSFSKNIYDGGIETEAF